MREVVLSREVNLESMLRSKMLNIEIPFLMRRVQADSTLLGLSTTRSSPRGSSKP